MPGESCIDSANTAWVIVSTMLVLVMTPALGLFEAGMLRAKNTTSVLTQVFTGGVLLSFMWQIIGFSLSFGKSWGFMGSPLTYPILIGVETTSCFDMAPTVPKRAFAMFQMMFAAICPLLMTGSFAERLRLPAFFWIIVGFEVLVYYPVVHWIWGGGWLGTWGVIDFAGGIVLHTTAGAGAIVIAWYIGPRHDDPEHMLRTSFTSVDDQGHVHEHHTLNQPLVSDHVVLKESDAASEELEVQEYNLQRARLETSLPSSLPLTAIGGALLWLCWFGFNAGSAYSIGSLASSAVSATQAGAVGGGCVWASWSIYLNSKVSKRFRVSLTAVLNGIIAGLAGITPASGYISVNWALVSGMIIGVVGLLAEHYIKHVLHIDDALDVGAVHGATGVTGSLLIGFFGDLSVNPAGGNGLVYGGSGALLGKQFVGVIVAGFWSALMTYLICLSGDKYLGGLRSASNDEDAGLDLADHDEVAYEWLDHGHHTHHHNNQPTSTSSKA